MSSELTDNDHMFSVKETPWHRLGSILKDHPKTSEEAIKAAKLDWTVQLEKLQTPEGLVIPDTFATIRNDPRLIGNAKYPLGKIPLGVVGSKYRILPNTEAFAFFDQLTIDGVCQYETAGSLKEGRKVWILAKMKEDLIVADKDIVRQYILLSNSHDGTGAIHVKMTPTRVVCNNTLSAALRETALNNSFSLRHTQSANDKLKHAQMTLEAVSKAYEKLGNVWRKMAEIKLPKTEQYKYINRVFPTPKDSKDQTKLHTLRAEVAQLLVSGAGATLDSALDTLWGSYNAVTQHVTHHVSTRKNSTIDTHVEKLWYGTLADTLDRAFEMAMTTMEEKGIDTTKL